MLVQLYGVFIFYFFHFEIGMKLLIFMLDSRITIFLLIVLTSYYMYNHHTILYNCIPTLLIFLFLTRKAPILTNSISSKK